MATQLIRFSHEGGWRYGALDGDVVVAYDGDPFSGETFGPSATTLPLMDVEVAPFLDPHGLRKVIGVALNYRGPDGAPAFNPHPAWFTKSPWALNSGGETVTFPADSTNFNYEGELVVVIGRGGRDIPETEAAGHVLGVTVGNDWSENDWWWEDHGEVLPSKYLAKAGANWASLHPSVFCDVDWTDLPITVRVNEELSCSASTRDMVHGVEYLVHYLSHYVTLEPGDIIFTGTMGNIPGTRRTMRDGDHVEVEIVGLGVLSNHVALDPDARLPLP